ncbi:protein FAM47E-like isoform X1 [Pantherophis guttatus]|uniref:Protein FAM47E-like isoform X1 n=1 Tax=Pantherophis guttatus TaxID=94885 RepID=A0ABM3Z3S5_PANGU|nr:protein FAM47E-like isoform X1 [Pantherophis guttatus]
MPFQFFQRHGAPKSRFSGSLNGQHWRFLRSNLDYSREAFPLSGESILTQPEKGPSHLLLSEKPKNLLRASQRSRKRLSEPQSYTSKLSLMSQSQKDHVAQVEYCLSQHPLALYPNFEESIPAELFKEVMSILDPEVLPTDQEPDASLGGEPCPPPTIPSLLEDKRNRQARAPQAKRKDPGNKAPYTWFSPTKVAARELKARLNYVPPLDENIKRATKELCDGFNSLGGEKYSVDEDTVLSMFDAAYETTLPMFHPLRVEELRDLPMDLKKHFGMLPSRALRKNQDIKPSKDACQSRWERKIRYGAWYLDPKTWKKQNVNEPLENPKESSLKNSRRLLSEEDAKLIHLHGTHAFQEFLVQKGYRIPEFLQQMLEEQNDVEPKVGGLKNAKDEPQKCKELREDYSAVVGNKYEDQRIQ